MVTLELNQEITLYGIKYTVTKCVLARKFYLSEIEGNNSRIFKILNIKSKHSFVFNLVGYATSGDFPEVKTLEHLTIVVEALINYNKLNKIKLLLW